MRFLDAVPMLVMILNAARQIVYANRAVLEYAQAAAHAYFGR